MNMFKKIEATSIDTYLTGVPATRRDTLLFLHDFIQKTVPNMKPYFAHNMLGYGNFPYKNYKKQLVDWPVIALANQKHYMSLYICSMAHGTYIAEVYRNELGKVDVGKSCIRFKKLEDLNLPILKKVLLHASQHPGLV